MNEIDPKTVREIAREIILDCGRNADDVGTYVYVRVGADLSKHEHGAWCSAIREAIRTAQITVSWPDEQQPAEATGGEQVQDGAAGRAPGLLCRTTGVHDGVRHYCTLNTAPHKVHQDGTSGHVWTDSAEEFEGVLAERAVLAARVAELEGERDLWRTRAYQVGNMLIGERDPEVVPFLGVPCQEPTAPEPEES